MPELANITIEGFKSIAAANIWLGSINLVIGANGSGKSNFLGVFSFLQAVRGGRLQDYVVKAGGAERVLHFGSKVTSNLNIRIAFQNARNEYELNLQPTGADELIPTVELVYFGDRIQYPEAGYREGLVSVGKEAGISAPTETGNVRYVRENLERWRLYHFHDTSSTSPIRKTADLNDNRYLRPDGSNLPAFLYFLRESHQTSYGLIRRIVQRVSPFFDDFLLEPQKLNADKIRLEWRHRNSEAYFDASSLSDGTLRFIALATLFLQPELYRPSVMLVDEPELGLHPYAITMLASLVKQASIKTQVILSTQSPLLLDHFEPEDVIVADLVNGATQFTRLDSARLADWLKNYSLGQLWEKNEFGGRPGGE